MFKKFPLKFLNSLLGFLGCMGSGISMMKQYPSCHWPGLSVLIAYRSFNFTVSCRIHIFTMLLKMGVE
jgi:hypothetical protein